MSAAVWFDFFLTRPFEHFSISRASDIETTVLVLVIGFAVTEIAVWGGRQHADAGRRAGYLDGINDAAGAIAAGRVGSGPDQRGLTAGLTQLLGLRSCEFQYGMAGLGRPGPAGPRWPCAPQRQLAGQLRDRAAGPGRRRGCRAEYLMQPGPAGPPAVEQLRVAVALAHQAGAALAPHYPVAS